MSKPRHMAPNASSKPTQKKAYSTPAHFKNSAPISGKRFKTVNSPQLVKGTVNNTDLQVEELVRSSVPQTEFGVQSVSKNAAIMSVLVVMSRITGFLRTWAQMFAMGVTVLASCYTVANNLPNQLFELVCGGMLVTAFLPVYMKVKKELGHQKANDYTSNLISLIIIIMGAVCVLGVIFASQVVWTQSFSAQSNFDGELASYFFRFFAIEVVLYSLSTIISGVLNAERDYVMSSAAPIFNNIVVSASFFLYAFLSQTQPVLAIFILAIGNPLGVLIQVLVQLPSLKAHHIEFTWQVRLDDPYLKETLSIGIPSLIVTIVGFVSLSVQTSSALSVNVAGSSIAYYTRLWYTLPYSIFAIPITTALFTELSEKKHNNDMVGYVRGIEFGTSQILFFLIPCMVLLIVFAHPLIVVLAGGKLTPDDIRVTEYYLGFLALSLPFFGLTTYLQKICSSLRKMKLYALTNVVAGICEIAFCLTLTPVFGLNVVALAPLLYGTIVVITTYSALKFSFSHLSLAKLCVSGLLFLCMSLLVGTIGYFAQKHLGFFAGDLTVFKGLIVSALGGGACFVLFIVLGLLFRMPEVEPLRRILVRAKI